MRAKAFKMSELEISMLAEQHSLAGFAIVSLISAIRELRYDVADGLLIQYEERIKKALQTLKDLKRHLDEIGDD